MFLKLFSKTYRDNNGYKRFKDSGKLVHRYVVEKKFGHKLSPGSVVHHKNRNKSDNRSSNLWVFGSQSAHSRAHKRDSFLFGGRASYKGFRKRRRGNGRRYRRRSFW